MDRHTILSGLAGQVWLGDQLDSGWITAKRGIDRFTEDGEGAYLMNKHGEVDAEPTRLDCVIYASGYRQQVSLLVGNLRCVFQRS